MSHGCPAKCTGTIALVRGVHLRAASATLRLSVSGSQSTRIGRAPVWITVAAVEAKVSVGTSTSSPGPMPSASSPRCRPAVAELTATACGASTAAAKASSKARVFGPIVSHPERSVSTTASISS